MRKLVGVVAVACCLGGPAMAAGQATAPPPPPLPTGPGFIPAGVTSMDVPLEGLNKAQAVAKLEQLAKPKAQRRLEVHVGSKTYVLTTGRLRLRFDSAAIARRALKAKKGASVAPVISFRSESLSAFVRRAAQISTRSPRNASIRITVHRIIGRKAKYGKRIDASKVDQALRRRIKDPLLGRGIRPKLFRVRPGVRIIDLKRRNPVILTVDRAGHRLRLFKRLHYDRSYPIAVGAAGFETPTGLRHVLSKQVNPAWTAPNRPWAGSYAGRTVPGGAPDNPLKARFIALGDGIGIHGTSEDWSIGSSASHGCIRMHVSDVIDLFPRVPMGAPVLIGR